jgi:hypothetical protein
MQDVDQIRKKLVEAFALVPGFTDWLKELCYTAGMSLIFGQERAVDAKLAGEN